MDRIQGAQRQHALIVGAGSGVSMFPLEQACHFSSFVLVIKIPAELAFGCLYVLHPTFHLCSDLWE